MKKTSDGSETTPEGTSKTPAAVLTRQKTTNVTASTDQSRSLNEVVVAVGDLDSVTAENSALVERTQHRSHRLIERAQQLDDAVSHIRLRQGTAHARLKGVNQPAG